MVSRQPFTVTGASAPDRYVALCRAAGDGVRRDVLCVLRQESLGVLELCRIFGVPQPRMSHHLKILLNAGLVQTRREGTYVFYRRAISDPQDPCHDLHVSLMTAADQLALAKLPARRLAAVHRERARQSQAFFTQHAAELHMQQARIAGYADYAECFDTARRQARIADRAQVLEVGPGDSPLLAVLAADYAEVTALDNAAPMLALARERAAASNVHFIEGELDALVGSWDLIVLNMVLHHMPSPAAAINNCAALLHAGGTLLLADLCTHQQTWARKACGDRWLGFEPAALLAWATSSGLVAQSTSFAAMKNGFQVQVHTFTHSKLTAPNRAVK